MINMTDKKERLINELAYLQTTLLRGDSSAIHRAAFKLNRFDHNFLNIDRRNSRKKAFKSAI